MRVMANADYFSTITFSDYAALAFGIDQTGTPGAAFDGGIYAGQGTAWQRKNEQDTAAAARLVVVTPPKVFVRWFDSSALTAARNDPKSPVAWAKAAGPWWSSDAMADLIVNQTRAKFGDRGDSGLVSREFSAVKYEWNSDMRGVIVCELTRPIRVLLGVGRPVTTTDPKDNSVRTLGDDRELQCVILTQYPRGTFRAHEFMRPLFFGASTDFTAWWHQENITAKRRAKRRSDAAKGQLPKAEPVVRVPQRP